MKISLFYSSLLTPYSCKDKRPFALTHSSLSTQVSISTSWLRLVGAVTTVVFLSNAINADAQITPDTTLPNNSSIIQNGNTFNIIGGTQAGQNLGVA